MHTQSERFNLNPLIQLQDSRQDVNEMKSLSLIGLQWEHRRDAHICIGKDRDFSFDLWRCLNIEYFLCFLNLRGSWTTSYKTKTTSCLFLLFMEDRKWSEGYKHLCNSLFLHILCTLHSFPPPHLNNTSPHWTLWMCQPAPWHRRWLMLVRRNGWKFRDGYQEKCGNCETGILWTFA